MTFFDIPEPPESAEPVHPSRPVWLGPRPGVLPGLTDQRAVLVKTDDAIMYIDGFRAYPDGIEFAVSVETRGRERQRYGPPFGMQGAPADSVDEDFIRFGICFADGQKWTNLDRRLPSGDDDIEGPVVLSRGGGGGDDQWTMRYWIWPLPKLSTMSFVVSWPAEGIEETVVDIDTTVLHDASKRAEVVWHPVD